MDDTFWHQLDDLVATSRVVIDRPRGSAHPRYPAAVYPVDYGYLDGTTGGDGDGIDVWVGMDGSAVRGIVCTVDLDRRDAEYKLLLGCSDGETQQILVFLNTGAMAAVLVPRPPSSGRGQ